MRAMILAVAIVTGCGDDGPQCDREGAIPDCPGGVAACDSAGDPATMCVDEDGDLFVEPFTFSARPVCSADLEPSCPGEYTLRCLPCPGDRAMLPPCSTAPAGRVGVTVCD